MPLRRMKYILHRRCVVLSVNTVSTFLTFKKATVAAIGMLSSDSCKYAARPIMFLGTCKKERSEEHMQLIKTILRACNRQKT